MEEPTSPSFCLPRPLEASSPLADISERQHAVHSHRQTLIGRGWVKGESRQQFFNLILLYSLVLHLCLGGECEAPQVHRYLVSRGSQRMCPESSSSIPSLPKMGEMRKSLRKRSWGGSVQRSVRAYQLGKKGTWTGKGQVTSVNGTRTLHTYRRYRHPFLGHAGGTRHLWWRNTSCFRTSLAIIWA